MGVRGRSVEPDERCRAEAQAGAGERPVGDAAAQAPAPRVRSSMSRAAEPTTTTSGLAEPSVLARASAPWSLRIGRLYSAAMALRDGDPVWFYELHEGDDERVRGRPPRARRGV